MLDSHAHLDDPRFDDDRDEVISSCLKSGVARIINIGADIETSRNSAELALRHDFIYAACGVHPHEAKTYCSDSEETLKRLAEQEKVVAIGEIGLDYHYDNSPRDAQQRAFAAQIRLAGSLGLPVVIHDREAHRDCLDILEAEKTPGMKGVFHCYSGSAEMVREIVELGFYISFTGVLTFKNSKKTHRAAKAVPVERLLSETDSPYMSPEPARGARNTPANVGHIVRELARVKEMDYESMCRVLWENTHNLFERLPNNGYMIK